MQHKVTLVWKVRSNGSEVPWVYVTASAGLKGEGDLHTDTGLGLYAWRDFERDEAIQGWGAHRVTF